MTLETVIYIVLLLLFCYALFSNAGVRNSVPRGKHWWQNDWTLDDLAADLAARKHEAKIK